MNPAADSALLDSNPSGGPNSITDRESISKNSKSPFITHSHMVCECRDETGDWNTIVNTCGDSQIISVSKIHVNVPIYSFLWFQARSWNEGWWSFEPLEKYETAASLRLAVALLLWTQTETAINLNEKTKSFTLNHVNEWDREIEAWRFPSPHLAASSQPRDTSRRFRGSEVKLLMWKSMAGFPGGL